MSGYADMMTSRSYVLIIDLDEELRQTLDTLLRSEGLEVVTEPDMDQGLDRIMERDPSIVIMSEDMPGRPDEVPLTVLRDLTDASIVIIGGGSDAIVQALLDGADLYLVAPIGYREFLSRVRSFLRRSERESDSAGER